MCVWQGGDMPRSTKVVESVAPQNRHPAGGRSLHPTSALTMFHSRTHARAVDTLRSGDRTRLRRLLLRFHELGIEVDRKPDLVLGRDRNRRGRVHVFEPLVRVVSMQQNTSVEGACRKVKRELKTERALLSGIEMNQSLPKAIS